MDVRLEQPDAENDLQFSGRFSFLRVCKQDLSRHCGEHEVMEAQPEGSTPTAAAVCSLDAVKRSHPEAGNTVGALPHLV